MFYLLIGLLSLTNNNDVFSIRCLLCFVVGFLADKIFLTQRMALLWLYSGAVLRYILMDEKYFVYLLYNTLVTVV